MLGKPLQGMLLDELSNELPVGLYAGLGTGLYFELRAGLDQQIEEQIGVR